MTTFKENLVLSQISYIEFDKKERGLTIGALLNRTDSRLYKFLKI